MEANTLSQWPIKMTIPVAWGDMDALGHVNNTVSLRWFESARIAYIDALEIEGMMQPDGIIPILARQSCDYRSPVTYPDTVTVKTTISKIGNRSVTLSFEVYSHDQQRLVSEGEGVLVLIDAQTGQTAEVTDSIRSAIFRLEQS